jgi:uncharacterized membrane protein HdeD (DUF308 family)
LDAFQRVSTGAGCQTFPEPQLNWFDGPNLQPGTGSCDLAPIAGSGRSVESHGRPVRAAGQCALLNPQSATGTGAMAISLEAAAEAFREAMRESVRRYALWYLVDGGLLVAAGVVAVIYPVLSSVAVVALLGWVLIVSGLLRAVGLIGTSQVPHFWLQLIAVVLAVVVGILFLRDPAQGLLPIALLLIMFFMVEGMSKVIFALSIRPLANWGWVLASGVVGILLALFLWTRLSATTIWLIGVLIGLQLICEGAALAYLAWHLRRSQPGEAA